jgi:CRISPR/Cas system-associated endonuclease Cas1
VQRWRRRSARHSLVRFDCAEAAYQFSVSSAAPFARPIDVHHERDDSPAFVFDIMEPDRPKVDQAVLAFLKSEALHPADFTIREDGVVRLNQELARRCRARL